jgi:3-oxoacyl-[acyl-carrier-protein] synthase II
MRRVVVTGLGLLTPLGQGVDITWKNILAGKSGANRISAFDPTEYACQVACEVPRVDGRGGGGPDVEGAFNPDLTMSPRDQKRVDDFILYGIAAADEAVKDSGWVPETEEDKYRTGVILGSGIGGLSTIADTALELEAKGPRRVSPFFISSALINLISGQVSIRYGFKGPNHAVVTACATGAHAIGDATRLIKYGDADVMIAGGAEAAVCKVGMAGFIACRAVSTDWNATPEKASRPYDKDRDGFVMGEGAGVVVLEEYEHAKARGAKIYAEVIGYGLSGDAYHITAPSEDGDGGFRALSAAVKDAGHAAVRHQLRQRPRHLDHGRRHRGQGRRALPGRSRQERGDVVDQVDDRPPAGRGRRDRGDLLDPGHPRPDRAADHQPGQSGRRGRHEPGAEQGRAHKIDVAVSNSFGFGGTNARRVPQSLVSRKPPPKNGPQRRTQRPAPKTGAPRKANPRRRESAPVGRRIAPWARAC